MWPRNNQPVLKNSQIHLFYLFRPSYRVKAMRNIGKLRKPALCSSDQHKGSTHTEELISSVSNKSLHNALRIVKLMQLLLPKCAVRRFKWMRIRLSYIITGSRPSQRVRTYVYAGAYATLYVCIRLSPSYVRNRFKSGLPNNANLLCQVIISCTDSVSWVRLTSDGS